MATGSGARQTAPAFQDSFSLRGAPVSGGVSNDVLQIGNSEKSIFGSDLISSGASRRAIASCYLPRQRAERKGLRAEYADRRGERCGSTCAQQCAAVQQRPAFVFISRHLLPLLSNGIALPLPQHVAVRPVIFHTAISEFGPPSARFPISLR
jgi:hypothetical protein